MDTTPNSVSTDDREPRRGFPLMDPVIRFLQKGDLHYNTSADLRDKAYTSSYRHLRLGVGIIGIGLPIALMIGESFIAGNIGIRGSLSAYYHSSMRDIFVGALCIVAFLLGLYMSGECKTWDFWVSLTGGVTLLGVVFLPTNRPGIEPPAPLCGAKPEPPGCSAIEQQLGEMLTARIHAGFAIVFIVSLACMSFLFAISEVKKTAMKATLVSKATDRVYRSKGRYTLHVVCALVIVAAGAWALIGGALKADIDQLKPLYLGEVLSVWAFGLSWFIAGLEKTAPRRVTEADSGPPQRSA